MFNHNQTSAFAGSTDNYGCHFATAGSSTTAKYSSSSQLSTSHYQASRPSTTSSSSRYGHRPGTAPDSASPSHRSENHSTSGSPTSARYDPTITAPTGPSTAAATTTTSINTHSPQNERHPNQYRSKGCNPHKSSPTSRTNLLRRGQTTAHQAGRSLTEFHRNTAACPSIPTPAAGRRKSISAAAATAAAATTTTPTTGSTINITTKTARRHLFQRS